MYWKTSKSLLIKIDLVRREWNRFEVQSIAINILSELNCLAGFFFFLFLFSYYYRWKIFYFVFHSISVSSRWYCWLSDYATNTTLSLALWWSLICSKIKMYFCHPPRIRIIWTRCVCIPFICSFTINGGMYGMSVVSITSSRQ